MVPSQSPWGSRLTPPDHSIMPTAWRWDETADVEQSRPWTDGLLWPRSRYSGAEMSLAMLSENSGTMGRWGVELDDRAGGGAQAKKVIGLTLDSVGAVCANAIVQGFVTATDAYVGEVTSDTGGYYELPTTNAGAHYLVAYKAGSPDIAGTTVNTIVPV